VIAGLPARTTGEPDVGSPVLLLHRLVVAGLAGLLMLLGLASISWPHSWDHGIFAWIGDAIVHGGMPYREAWDIKGPFPYYVFAAAELLFGRGMWGIRVLDLLLLAAGAGAAARIVSRLAGPGAAAYTALVVALQYAGSGYFDTAQPDGWAGALLLLALVPLVSDETRTSSRRAAGSALVLGLCLLIKPTYVVFGAVPAAYLLLGRDLGRRARVRGLLLVIGAFAVPALACAAWFAVRGAWTSLVEGYLLFNLQQAGAPIAGLDTSIRGAVPRFARRLFYTPAVVLTLGLAAVAAASLRRENRRALLVLALATAAAFFTVFVQQRYWNRYQWHAPYMVLGVLAGCGVGLLWHDQHPRAAARLAAGVLGAVLLAAILPRPVEEVRSWLAVRLGRESRGEYEERFRFAALSWSIADARALAEFLRSHTAPDERVLVWSDPMVYYLSERASVGRFGYHGPVAGNVVTPLILRQRAELLGDLSRHAPRYFAVGRRDLDVADSLNESNIAGRFPALYAALLAEYVPVARFGERELYQRRTRQAASP
jgi:hypothetical protein